MQSQTPSTESQWFQVSALVHLLPDTQNLTPET